MRYPRPAGHLFPQPNLRSPVRSFPSFNVQVDSILQFRRVGDLAHNTVLLVHLSILRGTSSCLTANICSGCAACVKPKGTNAALLSVFVHVY